MSVDLQTNPGPTLTHLVSGIISDAQALLKQQLALFRTEMAQDIKRTKQALMSVAIGLALASIGATLLCFMAVYGLEAAFPDLPLWACFGIVGGGLSAGGGLAFYLALKQFQEFNPLPDESAQALKENVQWISQAR